MTQPDDWIGIISHPCLDGSASFEVRISPDSERGSVACEMCGFAIKHDRVDGVLTLWNAPSVDLGGAAE